MARVPAYRFFTAQVVRATRVSPTIARITFGGDLSTLVSGGRDQRFKLFLPHPGQEEPVVPTGDDWYAQWRAMDPDVRAIMRTYTVYDHRRAPCELDVEFALHGDVGPASRWAATARPGDRVRLLGPAVPENGGFDFRPPDGTDWILLAADETALPAVAGILTWLSPDSRVQAWIEVPHAADIRPLPTAADAEITWLVRDPGSTLVDEIRGRVLPAGTPYAWLAGEAGAVRALRRHLVSDRAIPRKSITFTGYWRRGANEEDLLAEAVAAAESRD